MPAAYSLDLRERVIGAVESGASRRRAATVFKVSVSSVIRWAKRVDETGSYAPLPTGAVRWTPESPSVTFVDRSVSDSPSAIIWTLSVLFPGNQIPPAEDRR